MRGNYINGRGKRARGGGEILIGIGLCIRAFRQKAAFASLLLMLAFTPIHLWDLFSATPAIGSRTAAWIRIAVQSLFIAWMYWLSRPEKQAQ